MKTTTSNSTASLSLSLDLTSNTTSIIRWFDRLWFGSTSTNCNSTYMVLLLALLLQVLQSNAFEISSSSNAADASSTDEVLVLQQVPASEQSMKHPLLRRRLDTSSTSTTNRKEKGAINKSKTTKTKTVTGTSLASSSTTSNSRRRPVVYTFFHHITDQFSSKTYDHGMLDAWSKSWYDMGWEPRVLTLEDAMKHPRYEEYNKVLDNVQLDKKTRAAMVEYNRLCYLRWLAMAAVGGGFMSDYDTVAISPPKPGDESPGQFTLYDNTCPALLSGSGEEWERLAWLILDYGHTLSKQRKGLASDMVSLKGVYENQTCDCKFYIKEERPVTNALHALERQELTNDDCQNFNKYRAVHFSHHMVGIAYETNPSYTYHLEPLTKRPEIMKQFFRLYKQSCYDNYSNNTNHTKTQQY